MSDPGRAVDPLEALRQEFAELRLLLDADLTVAAAAFDDGEAEISRDVVTGDADELAAFQARVLARLRELDAEPVVPAPRRTRLRRMLPGAPLVAAAAAAVGLLSGVVPLPGTTPNGGHTRQVAQVDRATAYFQRFSQLAATDADAAQMMAAADDLHRSLESLIAAAGRDPRSGAQAMRLLELEQQVLLQSQPDGLSAILAQARELVAQLQAALPGAEAGDQTTAQRLSSGQAGTKRSAHQIVPLLPTPSSTARAGASPSPRPTATPSSKPSSKPSTSPSASPSPSSTPAPLPVGPVNPFSGF